MKLTFCWITLLELMQLFLLFGADDEYSRRSLAGITAVDVLVESLPPAAAKLGLTMEDIKTDVELKLRLAGMRVESASYAFIYVNVNVAENGIAANIDIKLEQPVALVRNSSIVIPGGITWSIGTLVTNPTAQGIRGFTKDLVDSFLNAWLSVNPKK
jgi:hypothetical protein